jgi:hypothetical protein
LQGRDGKVFRLCRERHGVMRVGPIAAPRRHGGRGSRSVWQPDAILVLDAGDLRAPIRSYDDLHAAVGSDRANTLARAQKAGLSRVLLTYRRREVQGVLGLALDPDRNGEVTVASVPTAPDDLLTRSLRSHPDAAELGRKRVAVVGVGAIGSVVADLLHRSGVGHLFLLDDDLVLPGNTTRHLLGEDSIGLPKARAVAEALQRNRPRLGAVSWQDRSLNSVGDALELLDDYDVVVDATADSTATAAPHRGGQGRRQAAAVSLRPRRRLRGAG